MNGETGSLTREELIERIRSLQLEITSLEQKRRERSDRKAATINLLQRYLIHLALGRRLSNAMSRLHAQLREKQGPVLGKELAQTLDAAASRMIGYKRWLVIFGLLAAMPGIISLVLLWQQNLAVAETKEKVIYDTGVFDRFAALTSIYSTNSKTEVGLLTTPFYNAQQRRESVLRLMESEPKRLPPPDFENDPMGLRQMIDLSVAPLNGVDFSALPGSDPITFRKIGFNNSNFEDSSFQNCEFEKTWFSSAFLIRTNFRNATFRKVLFDDAYISGADFTGATFDECDFTDAKYDRATLWPEGFDPKAAGAIAMQEE